ncbi:MAG: Fic family protein [Sediminibacterium sp.]|nr:Fic family protein [Sediminibacterium sp.]
MLNEQTFTFSPAEYLAIHRILFIGIYKFAGKIRDYNITKKEWILNGETVLYASADSLRANLEYDFEQERKFNYKGLNEQDIIEHLVHFISNLWQNHIFGEGNTRTTAIFFIKYLRKLGFKNVNNDMFANHSWYFRNALVRANYEDLSKGIYRTEKFLIQFLLNLLLKGNYSLKNREMHLLAGTVIDTVKSQSDTLKSQIDTLNTQIDTLNDSVFSLIELDNKVTANEIRERLKISLSTVRRKIKELKNNRKIERIGSDKTGYWRIIEGGF